MTALDEGLIVGEVGRGVTFGGEPLEPAESLAIRNHSPTGFAWGYGGSGPAQLALSILLRVTDRAEAERFYQAFKWECIAVLPEAGFSMPVRAVRDWLDRTRAGEQGATAAGER